MLKLAWNLTILPNHRERQSGTNGYWNRTGRFNGTIAERKREWNGNGSTTPTTAETNGGNLGKQSGNNNQQPETTRTAG